MTYRDMVAWPGDDDLDFDVDELTIKTWSNVDLDDTTALILHLHNGTGWWRGDDGDPAARHDVTLTLEAALNDAPFELKTAYLAQVGLWADELTPLRVCAATGRLTTIHAPTRGSWPTNWLPFPSRPFDREHP